MLLACSALPQRVQIQNAWEGSCEAAASPSLPTQLGAESQLLT